MTPDGKIEVLVAEDHDIVRRGLVLVISRSEDMVIVAEASNGREAVEKTITQNPDVVLMDMSMPFMNGMEATRQIKRRTPRTNVLILSGYDDPDLILQIVDCGASGYLLKTTTADDLQRAIRIVSKGEKSFSSDITEFLNQVRTASSHSGGTLTSSAPALTQREREILQLIAEGRSHQQISDLLHISVRTVDTHRNNIIKKLDVHDAAGLVRYAIRNGIVILQKKDL